MLDHVTVGPFAEDPARKDAIPFVVALILHAKLDEGAGFRRILPRRGGFAGAQAHDRTTDADRFAGLHLDIANQPVALVEQTEHRDALVHRGRALDTANLLRHPFRLGRNLRALFARALAAA